MAPSPSAAVDFSALPWGSHLCHFYATPQDLLDTLAPFFKAGLRSTNTRVVAEQLAGSHPETKVLYVSGYTKDDVLRTGVRQEAVHFLQKPFAPAALAHKVREILSS
jgi:DNA-binding NarL/FixJ family response regulator